MHENKISIFFVYSWYIPGIYHLSEYTWYIRGIYLLYTSSGFQMCMQYRVQYPECSPWKTTSPTPDDSLRSPTLNLRYQEIGKVRNMDKKQHQHQQTEQSGQCIYITNMQNMNPALFCILILGFAHYFACWCIYMQNDMQNMPNNMQKNSAGFIFCIFCILQHSKHAEYVK